MNPTTSSQEVVKSTSASERLGRTPNDTVKVANATPARTRGKQTRKKRRQVRVRAAMRKATRLEASTMVTSVRAVARPIWLATMASTGAAQNAVSANQRQPSLFCTVHELQTCEFVNLTQQNTA